jgi:uncharacterized protein (UPF0333 family)
MAAKHLRGQVSLELMVTLGVVIAFTIPVVFLLLSVSSVNHEKAMKDQADAASRSLADSINVVYSQGAGAKRVVLLNSPASTKDITISGGEVVVRVSTSAGDYDAASPIFAQMNSNTVTISQRTGLFALSLDNVGGKVNVSVSQ